MSGPVRLRWPQWNGTYTTPEIFSCVDVHVHATAALRPAAGDSRVVNSVDGEAVSQRETPATM